MAVGVHRAADEVPLPAVLVENTEKRLLKKGWERLARVQEEGGLVKVLMLPSGESILGLVVLVVEENEIVFANVAGNIDMAQLGSLAEKMDIPGLDELPTE